MDAKLISIMGGNLPSPTKADRLCTFETLAETAIASVDEERAAAFIRLRRLMRYARPHDVLAAMAYAGVSGSVRAARDEQVELMAELLGE